MSKRAKRAAKPKGKKPVVNITFRNNKGLVMKLPGSLTIGDLRAMGMTKLTITGPDHPLLDGWWRSDP